MWKRIEPSWEQCTKVENKAEETNGLTMQLECNLNQTQRPKSSLYENDLDRKDKH